MNTKSILIIFTLNFIFHGVTASAQEICPLVLHNQKEIKNSLERTTPPTLQFTETQIGLFEEWFRLQGELPAARKSSPILAKVIETKAEQKKQELKKVLGPQFEELIQNAKSNGALKNSEQERNRQIQELERAREKAEVRLRLPPSELVKISSLSTGGQGKLIGLGLSPDGEYIYFKQHWDHVSRKSIKDPSRPIEDLSAKQESELWGFALSPLTHNLEPLVAKEDKLEFAGKIVTEALPNQKLYKGTYNLAHDMLLFSTSEHHGGGQFTYRLYAQQLISSSPAKLIYQSESHPDWKEYSKELYIYDSSGKAKLVNLNDFSIKELDFPFLSSFTRTARSDKFKNHIVYTSSRHNNANFLVFDYNNLNKPKSIWSVDVPGETPEIVLSPNGRFVFIIPRSDSVSEILVFDLQSNDFSENLKNETSMVQDAFFTAEGDLALFSNTGKLDIYRIENK